MQPIRNPITVPRAMAHLLSAQSFKEGSRPLIFSTTGLIISNSAVSKTSAMAKSPMATGRNPIPSIKSGIPKVNRSTPLTGSIPTVPRKIPKAAINRPLMTDSPINPPRVQRARMSMEKYSVGPKLNATLTKGSARSINIKVAKVPAMKEPKAAIPRAGPALPWRAI